MQKFQNLRDTNVAYSHIVVEQSKAEVKKYQNMILDTCCRQRSTHAVQINL